MSDCPTPEQLRRLLAEQLSGPEAAALEAHVQTCVPCQQALEQLTPTAGAAARRGPDPAAEETAFLRRLGENPPRGAWAPPSPADGARTEAGATEGRSGAGGPGEAPSIPGHVILCELGRGGMGVVYKARHVRLDRVVAVKVIRSDHLLNPDAVRRFCREIRAAAQLSHPHVAIVYEAGQAGAVPFFTMEYIAGINLADLVRRNGPLPVARACEYVRQAALGLQHAHEHGLVHRDVKPGNLLLNASDVVKLLDLGLSRLTDPAAASQAATTLTREGVVMGTPDFMAPEQIANSRGADIRADLYSLGCTFYYLLTGQVPFPEGTAAERLAGHLASVPRPVEDLRPEVPPEVAAVVRRLMAKRPEARYQTPAELASALAALAGASPKPSAVVVGPATTQVAPAARPRQAGRRWRGTVLAAVLGAGLLGLAVWLAFRHREEGPEPRPLSSQRQLEPEAPEAAIKRLGGRVKLDESPPSPPAIVDVDLARTKVTDADLISLESLATLKRLDLPGTGVGDAGLEHLKNLTKLDWLSLDGTQVGDAGLAHLRGLTRLQSLFLSGSRVGSAGLVHLKDMNELQTLGLNETTVDDVGLEHLKGCNQLVVLTLEGTKVSDAGMKHLSGLRRLETLLLSRTRVGDEGVRHLQALPRLGTLDLEKTGVTDVGLKHVQAMPQLVWLNLDKTAVTDAGLAHLKDAPRLQLLYLNETKVTDTGLSHLHGMVQLRRLTLAQTGVTDKGLVNLKGMSRLETLVLADTRVSNVGLEHLKGLAQLQQLNLQGTQVDDAGLVFLKGLTKLEFLSLMGARVGDVGMEHLKGMTQLDTLDLRDTLVSDAGLAHLRGLSRLQTLYLEGTRVTAAGVLELRKALPGAQITH